VLVVEDEANIRELVCLHLDLEHLAFVEAAQGDVALKLARDQRFDLVILDLMLPGLDGVTVCRAIRPNKYCGTERVAIDSASVTAGDASGLSQRTRSSCSRVRW
jgi:DNA-binding response OmpR family regulator